MRPHQTKFYSLILFSLFFLFSFFKANTAFSQTCTHWRIHDMKRPRPAIIDPGTASTQDKAGRPPSDAIILFDGKDLSQWRGADGGPAKWKVRDGFFETVKGAGYIHTLQNFGNCQLHIEWSAPVPPKGTGQGRGNSGVFLMGLYEVQVLDSYENETYADGQAAAIYGQYPPLLNACRPPGQWQTYDIIFHRPHFDKDGNLTRPARMTVLHNGVLVQDDVVLLGPTTWLSRYPYKAHPAKLPLALQDHGNPVRYRNIWIRELPDDEQPCELNKKEISLPTKLLDRYAGTYQTHPGFELTVKRVEGQLAIQIPGQQPIDLTAESETRFFSKFVDFEVEFQTDSKGNVIGLAFYQGGSKSEAKKIK